MLINGYENYDITEDGTISNLRTKRVLNKDGKYTVVLTKKRKRTTYNIAELILENFGISSFKTYLNIVDDFEIIVSEDNQSYCITDKNVKIKLSTLEVFEDVMVQKSAEIIPVKKIVFNPNMKVIKEVEGLGMNPNKELVSLETGEVFKSKNIFLNNKNYSINIDFFYKKYFN